MTVMTLEPVTILEVALEPEIFTLSGMEIALVLAQEAAWPKAPADPCIIEGVSEGFSDEPITEYQDSMDAAGYPYW